MPRRDRQASCRPLHIQLWSYNYEPEPTGIGPVSTLWAQLLRKRGHHVEVVAAHPHYPHPIWGQRLTPYRELRDGVRVLRLPLWMGRRTSVERLRQEVSFMASQLAALPALRRPDVLVSVSPSFPALLPAVTNTRLRNLSWLLWLQDILPDGAAATGLVESGMILNVSRWLERMAYRHAERIAVVSESFAANLRAKGVPDSKLEVIYNPATREISRPPDLQEKASPPRVLSMGNIGYSQGLAPLVAAFERSAEMREDDVRLVITGDGVATEEVKREIVSHRVAMLGLVRDERLEAELRSARLGLVSQHAAGTEFNLPSKLMNFMAYGLPVIAAVSPSSEVARLVEVSGGGWVVDSSVPDWFPRQIHEALADPEELTRRGRAAYEYARKHFSRERFAERFEDVVNQVATAASERSRSRRTAS